MIIREEIKKLEELGRMPDESENDLNSETIDLYAGLLKRIEKPVSWDEALILARLFPKYGLFGVEYSLMHVFESIVLHIEEDKYVQLIAECPSEEWREKLMYRLDMRAFFPRKIKKPLRD